MRNKDTTKAEQMLAGLLQAFAAPAQAAGARHAISPQDGIASPPIGITAGDLTSLQQKDPNNNLLDKPKAYLNYVFFDKRFKFVGDGSGVKQVDGDPGQLETLTSGKVVTKKNGYVYVYTSNESQQNVLFDNLVVQDITRPVLEETHYYPFGLTMGGISTIAPLRLENDYKFNGIELNHKEFSDGTGLELYTAKFRGLDPQIGRWWQIDPKPTYDISPYSAMGDDPILNSDLLRDTSHILMVDQRTIETPKSTLGTLTITNNEDKSRLNGYVLEPPKGTNKEAQTEGSDKAILPGTYKVIPHNSRKFPNTFELKNKKLLGTKSGILIHPGNVPRDTHGCQLVGCGAGKNEVTNSRTMLKKIHVYINNASRTDIKNGGNGAVSIEYIIKEPHSNPGNSKKEDTY